MNKKDLWIFVLFFMIILVLILVLIQIHRFMPVVKTCEDDFEVINRCGCVPCSWKNAEEYNKKPCINFSI